MTNKQKQDLRDAIYIAYEHTENALRKCKAAEDVGEDVLELLISALSLLQEASDELEYALWSLS